MRIKVKVVDYKDVEINELDLINIVESIFAKEFQIDYTSEVKGGMLVNEIEYQGSHSWYENEEIRKATENDEHLIKALFAIRKALHGKTS